MTTHTASQLTSSGATVHTGQRGKADQAQRQASGETATSSIRRDNTVVIPSALPNRLYEIKHAACGGAVVAESVVRLACPPGRSRLLRAAWRPCSRGRPGGRGGVMVATTAMTTPFPAIAAEGHGGRWQLDRATSGGEVSRRGPSAPGRRASTDPRCRRRSGPSRTRW